MFIWAGNRGWPKDVKAWAKQGYPLGEPHIRKAKFPYAGTHNGNGFLLYPGPRASIRLKALRDGAEDYAYIARVGELAKSGKHAAEAKALLDGIVPAVFVDTHYFAREPGRLLDYRRKLGEFIERAGG